MDLSIEWVHFWQFIKEWYWIPLSIIYVTIIFSILIDNKNPTKTMAWILVIVFIPIVGVILYYFFGQDFKKDLYFTRIDRKISNEFIEKWKQINKHLAVDFKMIEERVGFQSKTYRFLNLSKSSPPFLNNKIELLINGEQKFPKFLDAIRNAKHHIHLEYYIFDLDELGNEIIQILIAKANEGVEVRVTTDDFGSPEINKKAHQIFKNTKVKYRTFLPVRFNSLANSNFRNHRKILIVDGDIAFVGGINISSKYINTNAKDQLYWRDTSVMIAGDAVNVLQLRFWMDWKMAEGDDFNVNSYEYVKIHDKIENGAIISFGFTSPGAKIQSAMESMILAISLAKNKIRIATPYFIPSDEFKNALLIASNSGIEVELIIPKNGDSRIVQEASFSYTKKLMERGIKVYRYEKGFIHAKTIIIDDDIAFVGTVNLDNRSFFINFELTAVIHDESLINQLIVQHEIDKENSSLLTIEKWNKNSIFNRAFASICRLLAPIL